MKMERVTRRERKRLDVSPAVLELSRYCAEEFFFFPVAVDCRTVEIDHCPSSLFTLLQERGEHLGCQVWPVGTEEAWKVQFNRAGARKVSYLFRVRSTHLNPDHAEAAVRRDVKEGW